MKRRSLLSNMAAGSLALAGCTSTSSDEATNASPTEPPHEDSPAPKEELPEECPTTQDLGVEWPRDLNESSAAAFVEEYEASYYQQVVFEFEPESRFSRVGSAIPRVKNVSESNEGWRVQFFGRLGIEEANIWLNAGTSEPPDDVHVIPIGEVQDEQLSELLDEAAATGEAERRLNAEDTDPYIDRFERLSDEFEISPSEYSDSLYFDVNGTSVELSVTVANFHVDREWNAWYYVDEQVVWRSAEPDVDPRDGELLECRTTS